MNQSETYRGFSIFWQEPPLTSAKWTANVGSDHPGLYALMGANGVKIIDGATRAEMIKRARTYIDELSH